MLSCAGHWPPSLCVAGGIDHRAYRRISRPVFPFLGPLRGGCSCRVSAFFLGWPEFSPAALSSLAPSIVAIRLPFLNRFTFYDLRGLETRAFLNYGSNKDFFIPKTVGIVPQPWQFGQ